MPDLINSIIFSSGTVLKIPIFPSPNAKTKPCPYDVYTRAGGVIADSVGFGSPLYTALSNEDMLEFASIWYGTNVTAIDYNTGTQYEKHNISFFCYGITSLNNNYYLCSPFDSISGSTVRLSYRPVGSNTYTFYNSVNSDSDTFLDIANEVSNQQILLINVRPGNIYSIDIGTKTTETQPGVVYATTEQLLQKIANYQQTHPNSNISISIYDPTTNTDPYIIDDPADFGGGTGSREDPDEIEKATIPPLPTLSAVDTGLVTLYTATEGQLQSLGAYLWANAFDLETNFVKLFSNPMDCLIGLSIVPVTPSVAGAQNVKFGNITTSIALQKLSSQYVEVDCGTINLKEYIGSFLDYSPYVNISIYLPYIGYRELSPDDVMNDTIHVVYHIDVLSGGCCAMVETGKKGLLYSFNGSAITNVPITAINYSGAIQNAVSAVGAGLTMAAGIATGAAPLTAMGATSMLGNAANTAVNSKPTIQRSGSMGGAAGLMSLQNPLLIVTRPRQSVPANLNKFVGLTTNVTMNLGLVKGYTVVEHVHLAGIPAMQEEKEELARLLREGVIF